MYFKADRTNLRGRDLDGAATRGSSSGSVQAVRGGRRPAAPRHASGPADGGTQEPVPASSDRSRARAQSFWALRDVSFDVKQGEVVGIIGRNGAGKSTLLKILSRITEPTSGRAEIHGRVGSLLEVGTGFDRELTGRDNIYLSGAILGMKKREIDRKFDEIVAFAEVERFLDTPVKRYSSGMYLRLAFAVAAHLEPEILVLDEVLAVGDAQFQRRASARWRRSPGRAERSCSSATTWRRSHGSATGASGWIRAPSARSATPRASSRDISAPGSTTPARFCFRTTAPRRDRNTCDCWPFASGRRWRRSPRAPDSREPMSLEIEYRLLRDAPGLRVGARSAGSEGSVLLVDRPIPTAFRGRPAHARAGTSAAARFPGTFSTTGSTSSPSAPISR